MIFRGLSWLFVFNLVLHTAAYGQHNTRDSVLVCSLIDKAESFFTRSAYDSALHYCNEAEQYARKRQYPKGIAFAIIEKTDILIDKNDLTAADLLTPQTFGIGKQLNDSLITAIAWMQMAQVRMYGQRPEEAVTYFRRAIDHHFAAHPGRYAALAFNDFGYTCGVLGDLEGKARNLLLALNAYETLEGYFGEKAAVLNNLATLYHELKQRDKAIDYARQSLSYREKAGDPGRLALGCCNLSQFYLGVNDSAAGVYQLRCLKYAEQSGEEDRILHALATSSLVATSRKDTSAALHYELKSVALMEKSGRQQNMLAKRYISVGMAYRNSDSLLAERYFNKAATLAGTLRDKYTLRDLQWQLAGFYKSRGNYQLAYQAYNQYILYRDSIVQDNTAATIAALETRFESQKKDNEISRLKAAQDIRGLQIEKQEAVIAGNLLEAKRQEDQIELLSQAKELQELKYAAQREQLEKQILQASNNAQKLMLSDKEKLLRGRLLKTTQLTRNLLYAGIIILLLSGYFLFSRYQLKRKIQEQQAMMAIRNNIAKDLHDEIGSALTSIRILSEVSGRNLSGDSNKTHAYLQQITEQSAAAQQGMSDIVWAVRPENDTLENMVIRMREYAAATLESKDVITSIRIDESLLEKTLDMHQRRDFLLLYKEAINNIAKHAEARNVDITLRRQADQLEMIIMDDGRGFDPSGSTSSNGLRNMEARAQLLGGRLSVQTATGNGTSITLYLPAVTRYMNM
ncbi:sensor histidine kinase [Flavihumibacter petaseus]|uniref:histidine kinase n=1 Tax=Flavihumibacter petaseus NBRC 106054 TaxID=1220578 RepID=A0A0E9N361_9BACT|nr:ATP-binding protein [Flavihumibacter petaseus]GAO44269.1 putative two-component histidine kinase [Flavihumibacter petaseus NBRC 106054]